MFFQDLFVGIGAMAIAFVAADLLRNYFPNSTRFITAGLLIFAVDALTPHFTVLHLPGVWVGCGIAAAAGIWYLRKKRVRRQDGTIDNG